MKKRVFFY